MPDTTDRYALSLLSAAQAHKEITHNAALVRIDGLLHPTVTAVGTTVPPVAPNSGDAWIVGTGATDAWAQHSDEIALWQVGGWTYLKPQAGCIAWNRSDGAHTVYDGNSWRIDAWPMRNIEIEGKTVVSGRQPAVASPIGGSVIDAEARGAISQLLAAMRVHGLIEG